MPPWAAFRALLSPKPACSSRINLFKLGEDVPLAAFLLPEESVVILGTDLAGVADAENSRSGLQRGRKLELKVVLLCSGTGGFQALLPLFECRFLDGQVTGVQDQQRRRLQDLQFDPDAGGECLHVRVNAHVDRVSDRSGQRRQLQTVVVDRRSRQSDKRRQKKQEDGQDSFRMHKGSQ